MNIKLFKLMAAAILASQVSALFCMEHGDHTCDVTSCDYEFFGIRNGQRLQNIAFFVPIGLPSNRFYCSRDGQWCYNPKTQRVKSCNQESSLNN
ncbi:hypothetical protein BGZ92_011490, partial [Podila epicladia]